MSGLGVASLDALAGHAPLGAPPHDGTAPPETPWLSAAPRIDLRETPNTALPEGITPEAPWLSAAPHIDLRDDTTLNTTLHEGITPDTAPPEAPWLNPAPDTALHDAVAVDTAPHEAPWLSSAPDTALHGAVALDTARHDAVVADIALHDGFAAETSLDGGVAVRGGGAAGFVPGFSARAGGQGAGGFVVPDVVGGMVSSREADPREVRARHQRMVVLADFLVASMATATAIFLRFDGVAPGKWSLVPAVLPLIWVAIVAAHRAYEQRFLASGTEELSRVVRSGLWLFMVIACGSYAFHQTVPRSIVLFCVPVTVAGALVVRAWFLRSATRQRELGRGLEKTLVVGSGQAAQQLTELLERSPRHGMRPVGTCQADQVVNQVERTGAHVVILASHSGLNGHPLRQLSWALEERGVELIVSSGIVEVAGPRLSIRPVDGLSLLHLERPAPSLVEMLAKSVFDRLLGMLILTAVSPVLAVIGLAIRLTSDGPAFFRQTRTGQDGREFSIYKFRSMVQDAEHRLIDLAALDEGNGMLFKMRSDPRVTRVGGLLRKYSLDELPQLINVARGEMSLVGPRPPLPSEVAQYTDDALRRLRMRPGMTGLWQVSGRSDLSWEQSLQLDLHYVDNWRMSLDLSILWRTVRVVLTGSGAY